MNMAPKSKENDEIEKVTLAWIYLHILFYVYFYRILRVFFLKNSQVSLDFERSKHRDPICVFLL